MGQMLRTPDQRFDDLPGYAFRAHYLDGLAGCGDSRIHYLDEGPAQAARVYLCLHGQPTWSYLYRRMLPVFVAAGHRVVAPDLLGFGRSDKPAGDDAYSFTRHREMLLSLVEHLALRDIVLVVQDWGGLLGLTLPMEEPARYAGLLVMNTAFATGDQPLGRGFLDWRDYSNRHPDLAVGKLLSRACPHLNAAEAAAYDAPFLDADVASNIRNCPPPLEVPDGGHFLPEWGEAVAAAALEAL